ncbi:MAG: oligosaccharide flippase family protein [Desulfobacterales bacterium]|nr:oligosaccharide flippase family protein [Desulfobacterales bacterium]
MNELAIEKVGDKTRQSVKWTFTLQIIQKIFFFASSIVLARLLSPRDFGLATIAVTLDMIIWLVTSLGINAAVVHFQDNIEERKNAAFWLFLFSSSFFVAVQIVSAPYIAKFYGEPILADIIIISAIAMLISCLGAIHKTILIKGIEFKKISIIERGCQHWQKYALYSSCFCGVWSLEFYLS